MNSIRLEDLLVPTNEFRTRILIIAAHPDDETISAGGRLAVLPDVRILHVTDGAPRNMRDATAHGFETREAYARARREELADALALAGKDMSCTRQLDIADQEASLQMERLADLVVEQIESLQPDLVLTHPYEGGHPDHDATAFGAHAACALLARRSRHVPDLAEFASYHDKNGHMSYFEFLADDKNPVETIVLSEQERDLKRKMIRAFRTQQQTIVPFPVELERFRHAPRYDFTKPPHPGTLLYERFDWSMQGNRWRELASRALTNLGLGDTL